MQYFFCAFFILNFCVNEKERIIYGITQGDKEEIVTYHY